MILYSGYSNNRIRLILVFGVGLIGNSICKYIDSQGYYRKSTLSFNWVNQSEAMKNADAIYHRVLLFLSDIDVCRVKIAFIWSAGKAGFNATEKEMFDELMSYNIVLGIANRLAELPMSPEIFFHHFSSAGGLFEGQYLSDKNEMPCPRRSYGKVKYEQEKRLGKITLFSVKKIYRPTSVYGFSKEDCRVGLIQTLLLNSIRNKVTNIFGNLNTLRDYVFNDDIGKYVVTKLFERKGDKHSVFFLGGGKPSSIYEIKHIVEGLIGRRIYINYIQDDELANDKDIIISSSVMPKDWYPTELKLGVNLVRNATYYR